MRFPEVRRTRTIVRRCFWKIKKDDCSENCYVLINIINMDSSMGKMCLGKDVIEISSDRNEGSGNWDPPEYKDTTGNGEINLEKNDDLISNDYAVKLCLEYEVRKGNKLVKKEFIVLLRGEIYFTETDLPPMVCKIGKGSRNKKKIMENIMYFNNGAGPSSSVGTPLTQEEAEKGHLPTVSADKVRLDGKIKPEEERALVKVKGQMLKEKKDLGAFLFLIRLEGLINENALADTGSDTNTMPYIIYEQLGRDDIMQEERNITMINYTQAKVTGRLVNVLCQVGFITLSARFLILEIPIDRDAPIVVGRGFLDTTGVNINISNMILTTFDGLTCQTYRAARSEKIRIAESDSDDKEDYVIKRNDMGAPIQNSRPIGYQNDTNPAENITMSTLESVINPFRKISVWKKAVSFLGSLLAKLRDVKWKTDYKLCYSNPELATGQWKTKIHLTDPYGNIYMQAFMTKPTKRKLSKYHKLSDIMSPN
ncbi:reverse transcriptase domain-containing protein [Tanacetum coccineum]